MLKKAVNIVGSIRSERGFVMKKLVLIFFLIPNVFAQSIDKNFEQKILEYFNAKHYKACVDLGVSYLELNGSDSLKFYINKSKTKLLNYNPDDLNKTKEYINNAIRLSPKIIPEYAIYAGLAEVSFWMMYKKSLQEKDKNIIMAFSLELFKEALEITPKDSLVVAAKIYLKTAELLRYHGEYILSKTNIMLAYRNDPSNYNVGLQVASYYEEEGKIDSCDIILVGLYNRSAGRTKSQNVYEFLGDHSEIDKRKLKFYQEAINYGVKDVSIIYTKIAEIYGYRNKDKAIEFYKKALTSNPSRENLYIEIAFLSHLNNDDLSAIEYYTKIKNWESLPSFEYEFHSGILAGYYFDIGDYTNALKYYKMAKQHHRIAYCYLELGDYDQAIYNFNLDIEETRTSNYFEESYKNEQLAYSYDLIGRCYSNKNDRLGAFNSFEQSYYYDSTNDDVKYYLELYRILSNNLDWDAIANTDEQLILYNPQRTEKRESKIKVWIKAVLFPSKSKLNLIRETYIKSMGYNTVEYSKYIHSLIYYEYDCTNSRTRTFENVSYSETGTVIDHYSVEEPKWKNIIPESVGEIMLNTICK